MRDYIKDGLSKSKKKRIEQAVIMAMQDHDIYETSFKELSVLTGYARTSVYIAVKNLVREGRASIEYTYYINTGKKSGTKIKLL